MIVVAVGGCGPKHFLIQDYQTHRPYTILILPPVNNTPQEGVEDIVYPVFTRAVGDKGYYVYSPEYIWEVFKRNKLQDAGRIHSVPHEKLAEVFQPDALLYITVEEWAAKYYLLGNAINTQIYASLIDAENGEELFNMRFKHVYDPAAGQSSLAGKMVMALVSKMGEKSYIEPAAKVNIATIAKFIPEGKNATKW